MKRSDTLSIAALLAVSALVDTGLAAAAQPESRLAEVQMRSLEISDFAADHIVATVRVSATANGAATVRGLFFDQVTVNGVRVRIAPVPGPIHLRAGEAVDSLPELRAVLNYQELDSLDPVRRAVREGKARIHAEVRAQLELSLFQKIALGAGGAWVTFPVDQEIPVEVPGGALGRAAALATLVAAEPVWIAAQGAREWRQNRTALADTVRSSLPRTLVSIETRYNLKARDGQAAAMQVYRLGFLRGAGQVIAPSEVVEPWKFDPSIAEALDRGEIVVDSPSVDILVTPLGESRTYSLRHREVRIVRALQSSETAISAATKHSYPVRFRNNDANAALLEIAEWKNRGGGIEAAPEISDGEWHPAVIVRLARPDASPVLHFTQARLAAGRCQIQDPVDATFYGSPVWIKGGAVALLQDESSAAALAGIWKKLK